MSPLPLFTPLTVGILKTTRARIQKLGTIGILTIRDLLKYFPRDHEDTTTITPIFQLRLDEFQTVQAKILSIQKERTPRRGMQLIRAMVTDGSGQLECIWFQQGHLTEIFKSGDEVLLAGKPKEGYNGWQFTSPKIEKVGDQKHVGLIAAIYPEFDPITSKWLREKISELLNSAQFFEEFLPKSLLVENDLISLPEAIHQIHQPENSEALEAAKKRLAFEELFFIQLSSLQKKLQYQKSGKKKGTEIKMDPDVIKKFLESFPFTPTNAQKIAIYEILQDIAKPEPMNRLLQGDVGAGKTLVALAAILQTVKNNSQTVFLAPTEVLARQHFTSLERDLMNNKIVRGILGRDLQAKLLLGATAQKEKTQIKNKLATGELDLVIGTHALLTDDFEINKLGLVIIDEQHRFGVLQREALKKHGYPHILTMTATPIPRTLALTIYGDQDLSILDEIPPGRQEVITRLVPESKREQAYEFCRSEITKGHKVFVIAPLVSESEKMEDVASAEEEFKRWSDKFQGASFKGQEKVVPKIIQKVGFDFWWDNEKIWALDYPVEEMDMKKLEWHFSIPFLGEYDLKFSEVIDNPEKFPGEYERTMKADLKYPIDIMENKGKWLILDGLHRLMKAKVEGLKKVQVRKIPREEIPNIAKTRHLKSPPVIETSESNIQSSVALLHGQMKSKEKEEIMKQFQSGEKMVLVSTSVVEVGVDIPEATVMWIEGAERFGLAQLHQFRGRVGRSDRRSYCFLFSTDGNVTKRLRAMTNTNDGFQLAEIDLGIRGPGEVFGLRQSGIPDLKMASYTDSLLVKTTRTTAEKILTEDLELKKFPGLRKKLDELVK